MANIPNVRFKGFTDDWEQRKFGDENDLLTGYPFESEKFVENGIKLVRGMNVKRGYLDFSEEICMKWNSSDGLENYLLKDSDILIQMDGALIGKSYAKIKENQLPALLVQRVTRARAKKGIADPDFMYQTIQRDFLSYIGMNKTETAVPHLSLNDIKNFIIMMPDIEEQRKISACFSNLDHLITLHQRKCNETKELKKYMLQKMFPQNGKKIPEIRFAGFTDVWEQRKLIDLVDVIDGDRGKNYPMEADFSENGHTLFLNASNVTVNGFLFDTNQYITELKSNSMGSGKLQEDDIVVTSRGSLGHIALYNADISRKMPYVRINSGMLILRKKEAIISSYLYQYMKSEKGQRQIAFMSFGSAQPQLTKKGVESLEVIFPNDVEEQIKIGEYFSKFDHLITLHQRKCDELKEIKKFMLQNMFPQKG